MQKKEVKRLKKIIESYKGKEFVPDERKSELKDIVSSVHKNVDEQDDPNPPDMQKDEGVKTPS